MKNVFVYIGSRRCEKSNSKKVLDLLIAQINSQTDKQINYNIYYPNNIGINNCLGCCNCFDRGVCVLDSKDNFDLVKKKMLEADFIIFISPVYAHNITGDMKVFIDRISSWFHLFRLAGKKSVAISVSSTNGNEFVNSYLKKILELAGTEVISCISVTVDGPCMLEDKEFLNEVLPHVGTKVVNSMNELEFNTSREQEKYFASMREIYKSTREEYRKKSYEYMYWKKTGMLESETLKSYVTLNRQLRSIND